LGEDLAGDHRGPAEPRAAVDHPVPDPGDAPARVGGPEPAGERVDGGLAVADGGVELLVNLLTARAVLDGEPGGGADALDLAPGLDAPRRPLWLLEETELEA